MTIDSCVLTTKDFTILEVMFDRCSDRSSPLGTLLKRKLEAAIVIFRDDVAPAVATLSSRVVYRCGDREVDTRILCHDRMSSPGLFLPITTPLGLALLGLIEGQSMQFDAAEGPRCVLLETVAYQPEAARREREAIARLATPAMRRKAFRLVSGPMGGDT